MKTANTSDLPSCAQMRRSKRYSLHVFTLMLLPLQRYEYASEDFLRAKIEREYYHKIYKESYVIAHNKYTENDIFNPPEVGSSPLPFIWHSIAHHSFDFAKQVRYNDGSFVVTEPHVGTLSKRSMATWANIL